MRPGFGQFNVATAEYLQFAAQFGATDVLLNTPLLPGAERWELVDLVKLRLSVEQWGLKLSAIENVPPYFYDQIMLGGPRRDRQIENMIYTVRNIARAGIPIFGYNWMPSHVWRTPPRAIRGGALATAYDDRLGQQYPPTHGRVYTPLEVVTARPLAEELRDAVMRPADIDGYVVAFLLTAASVFFNPTLQAVIPNLVEKDALLAANSVAWSTGRLVQIIASQGCTGAISQLAMTSMTAPVTIVWVIPTRL